jgi:hypothetical protein
MTTTWASPQRNRVGATAPEVTAQTFILNNVEAQLTHDTKLSKTNPKAPNGVVKSTDLQGPLHPCLVSE